MKKYIFRSLYVMLLSAFLLSGSVSAKEKIKLNHTSLTMKTGTKKKLSVSGKHGRIVWKSSNKRVASVSKKGVVSAKNKGRASVTAALGRKKIFRCKVRVKKGSFHVHCYSDIDFIAPTCEEPGEKTYTCSCGDSYTVDIPSLGHDSKRSDFYPIRTVKPSRSGYGCTIYYCEQCGQEFEKNITYYNPSQEQVYNDLIALKTQYPNGMYWGYDSTYTSPYFWGTSSACSGFAYMISDSLFGPNSYRSGNFSDLSSLRVGDLVGYSSSSTGPNGHMVVVMEVHPDYMIVCEGNCGKEVRWGRKIYFKDISVNCFYTRYLE